MKKTTFNLMLWGCMALSPFLKAQNPETTQIRTCLTDEHNQQLLNKHPNMMGSETYENRLAPKIETLKTQIKNSNGQRSLQYTIPVVVHVIHNGEPIGTGANISDEQVLSQIQVLNEDYRRMAGTNGFNTHPDGADVEIEFCLASRTPDGCVTTGIDRIDMSNINTTWASPNTIDAVLKPATIWDASQYMNMWSVNFGSNGLLGYAQFPGGPANTDGVVSDYRFFGSNDAEGVTIPGVYNLGRTMTHEVGHYLGLYHTFESNGAGNGCSGNGDYCDDTPAVASGNYGCPSNLDSCPFPSGMPDMVENYMDYTNDACMNVFTNDQKARILATLQNSANRPNSTSSDACTALAAVNDDASIEIRSMDTDACTGTVSANVRITNYGESTLTSAEINCDIDGSDSEVYSWTGSLGYGEFEDITLPTLINSAAGDHNYNAEVTTANNNLDQRDCNNFVSYQFTSAESYASTTQVHLTLVTDDYGADTEWEFRDSEGTILYSESYSNFDSNTTFNYSFDVIADECYTFLITDSWGDGLTDEGGSYTLTTDDDTVIHTGSDFGDSEETLISTYTLSTEDYFRTTAISLYPNPVSSQLNISLGSSNNLPDSYEIFNILGQSILQKSITNSSDLSINTSAFSNGMYFIKLTKESSSTTLRFIKK
ncbi:M43 family zinc metalloprotease [Mangrovimonas sp. YM274]|uniref:M43 family zinc metalloprotease n=1 Tax=Mangrovimonas sp. YM274 TaxID=3070660 RepID=UPI0027DAD4D1|nr:M43 family zinc metalloprotease [Mangrovimonas sp. YM274]WMI68695.1 M43 family zinc metalloprotease [Mangrovimonas sp. YM274]